MRELRFFNLLKYIFRAKIDSILGQILRHIAISI